MTTKKHHTKTHQNGVTKAGLIINCVITSITIATTAILTLIAIATFPKFSQSLIKNGSDAAAIANTIGIILVIIMLIVLAFNIFSLIVSIRALKNKSNKVLLAGVLALFTGGLIAGILILVGRSEEETYNS